MRSLLLIFAFALQASADCPPDERFRFDKVETKLDLNGSGAPDVVARFTADDGDETYVRRALLMDAPNPPAGVTTDQWIETCHSTDALMAAHMTFEKVRAGTKDLLYVAEEVGSAGTFQYFTAEGDKAKSIFRYHNSQMDGQFKATNKGGKVTIQIIGDGELKVGADEIDLDQRAVKLRCRVRELLVQLVYEWDKKAQAFKETDASCVMGAAID